jgi:hypothetical protein
MTNTTTESELPYGFDDLLEEVAWAARIPTERPVAAQASSVEEPIPESVVIASSLHSRPPPASRPSFAISTGAHVSLERVARRRGAAPPSARTAAMFVGSLGLLVAAVGALALHVVA